MVETGARLVVVDPLLAHLPATIDSHRDQAVRSVLAPLYRLADEHGCAVIAVLHLNKGATSDPLKRIGGSIAFPAAARSVLLLARDPEDEDGEKGLRRVLAHVKCNLAPLAASQLFAIEPVLLPASNEEPETETARLRFLGESPHDGPELLRLPDREERSAVKEAESFLGENLSADEWRPSAEVKKAARQEGLSDKALRVARERLGVKDQREGFPAKTVWKLPDSHALAGGHDCHAPERARLHEPHNQAGLRDFQGAECGSHALSHGVGTTDPPGTTGGDELALFDSREEEPWSP